MILVTYLLIAGVLIPVVWGVPFWSGSYYKSTCYDPECLKTAEQLSKWIDPQTNPCDDFYQFACGRMVNSGDRPISWDYLLYLELKQILEGPPTNKETKCHQQVRQFYSLCMDTDKRLSQVSLLRQLGHWPLLDQSWSEDNWTFERAESILQQYGLGGGLFNIELRGNRADIDNKAVYIDVPNSCADQTFYEKLENNKSDEEVIKIIFSLSKQLNVSETALEESLKDANKVRQLWKLTVDKLNKLANKENSEIASFVDNRSDKTDCLEDDNKESGKIKLTISQMQDEFPLTNWRSLFNEIPHPSIRPKDEDRVYVPSFELLLRVENLLKTVTKKSLANYMMWSTAFEMADYLSADIPSLLGVESDNRWMNCVDQIIEKGLSLALASLLARKHSKESSTVYRALGLAENIREQLVHDLGKKDWIENATGERAQQKIRNVEYHVGFPSELLSNTKLDSHYKKLYMSTSSYPEAIRDLNKWNKSLEYEELKLHAHKFDWRYTKYLLERNGLYHPSKNVLEITGPQLIFQNIFNSKVPFYIAYGHVGLIVGHELIHSFTSKGLKYNENGDREDWVDQQSLDNLDDRAQCIIKQYSSFKEPITKLSVDGSKTQGETISDNGGLKVAYHAYRRAANIMGAGQGLPHLEHYTPDQLFFITATNLFCEMPNKERLEEIMKTPHPPNNVRVNGMMMNSQAFSEAFNCGKDDKMNPTKKCDVW